MAKQDKSQDMGKLADKPENTQDLGGVGDKGGETQDMGKLPPLAKFHKFNKGAK